MSDSQSDTPSDNPFASPLTFGGPPPVPPIVDVPDKDACQWAMLCHVAALAQFALPSFGQIIGPLILWLMKREQHPFIDEQGKESLNFQISLTVYTIVGSILLLITCVGVFLIAILALGIVALSAVYSVIGALAANKGQHFRYPMTIRFLK